MNFGFYSCDYSLSFMLYFCGTSMCFTHTWQVWWQLGKKWGWKERILALSFTGLFPVTLYYHCTHNCISWVLFKFYSCNYSHKMQSLTFYYWKQVDLFSFNAYAKYGDSWGRNEGGIWGVWGRWSIEYCMYSIATHSELTKCPNHQPQSPPPQLAPQFHCMHQVSR